MNQLARATLENAYFDLKHGSHQSALNWLLFALPLIEDKRAWSKVMLAIRMTRKALKVQS